MAQLDFAAFDADHHYYEAEDAFIRHVDRRMQPRCMQWATVGGKKRFMVGGKLNRFIPNASFDPVAKPGSLDEYFRGRNPQGKDIASLFGQPLLWIVGFPLYLATRSKIIAAQQQPAAPTA
jgi:hypothetical protein